MTTLLLCSVHSRNVTGGTVKPLSIAQSACPKLIRSSRKLVNLFLLLVAEGITTVFVAPICHSVKGASSHTDWQCSAPPALFIGERIIAQPFVQARVHVGVARKIPN